MKKVIYNAILIAIILVTIYQIICLPFTFYIWGIGMLIFWIWVKRDITELIAWLLEKKKTIEKPFQEKRVINMPDFEIQKRSYIELVKHCCPTQTQQKLMPFFENLTDYQGNYNYGTTLNYVVDCSTEKSLGFIERLDWKQEVGDLILILDDILNKNYNGLKVDFPKEIGGNTTLFLEDVFGTYNKCLNEHGMQMGFIDTQSDEYVFFVHKVLDRDEVAKLINFIGYNYFEK